jgi:polysaccharide export outer membrane protein
MKFGPIAWKAAPWLCLLPVFAFLLTGCESLPPDVAAAGHVDVAHLHVGDTVTVTYDGLPVTIPPHEESIKEDGTITLVDVGPVKAAGLTLGELQTEIYTNYVPKYYTHLDVYVTSTSERVYYVGGEVAHPGEQLYRDSLTVSRAIASAGDLTDFANHSRVYLTRNSTGQRTKLNFDRIISGDDPDPPVYPGDRIYIYRRLW